LTALPRVSEGELDRRRAAFEADPHSIPLRHKLIAALLDAGEGKESLSLLDDETRDPVERTWLAAALRQIDRTQRAERVLVEVLADDPLCIEGLRLLAEILVERGRSAEALPHLERLTRISPEDPEGGALLARAERDLGQLELAQRTLENAMTIDPYNGSVHAELARLEEAVGDWAGALEAWELVAELDCGCPEEIGEHLAEAARRANIEGQSP
jgi:tetratricopeptide (TPR) repeat protein